MLCNFNTSKSRHQTPAKAALNLSSSPLFLCLISLNSHSLSLSLSVRWSVSFSQEVAALVKRKVKQERSRLGFWGGRKKINRLHKSNWPNHFPTKDERQLESEESPSGVTTCISQCPESERCVCTCVYTHTYWIIRAMLSLLWHPVLAQDVL